MRLVESGGRVLQQRQGALGEVDVTTEASVIPVVVGVGLGAADVPVDGEYGRRWLRGRSTTRAGAPAYPRSMRETGLRRVTRAAYVLAREETRV